MADPLIIGMDRYKSFDSLLNGMQTVMREVSARDDAAQNFSNLLTPGYDARTGSYTVLSFTALNYPEKGVHFSNGKILPTSEIGYLSATYVATPNHSLNYVAQYPTSIDVLTSVEPSGWRFSHDLLSVIENGVNVDAQPLQIFLTRGGVELELGKNDDQVFAFSPNHRYERDAEFRAYKGGSTITGGAGEDEFVYEDYLEYLVGLSNTPPRSDGNKFFQSDFTIETSGNTTVVSFDGPGGALWQDTLVDFEWVVFGENRIPIGATLFDDEANDVDFSALDDTQISRAKATGIDGLLNALDGDDTIIFADSIPEFPELEGIGTDGYAFRGGRGNDTITGGAAANLIRGDAGDDSLTGGDGDDTLKGGDGNDILEGGTGDDRLTGDDGDDTIRFKGVDFNNSWARFRKAHSKENRDLDADVVVKAQGLGKDRISDVEIVKFNDDAHSSTKIGIEITRFSDGTAKGKLLENGVVNSDLTNWINGANTPDNKDFPSAMLWDTFTPIKEGTYAAYYREKGSLGLVIELCDWNARWVADIQYDKISRSGIQIHAGGHNGESEGCFLVNQDFRDTLRGHLEEVKLDLSGNRNSYFPVVPITVDVRNANEPSSKASIDQTTVKLRAPDGPVSEPESGSNKVNFRIKVDDHGLDHHRKAMDVFFAFKGKAEYGEDFEIRNLLQSASTSIGKPKDVRKHGDVWEVGDGIFGLHIGTNKKDIMKSKAALKLKILADELHSEGTEKLKVQITDVDLLRYSGGRWKYYDESKEDTDHTSAKKGSIEELFFDADVKTSLVIDDYLVS